MTEDFFKDSALRMIEENRKASVVNSIAYRVDMLLARAAYEIIDAGLTPEDVDRFDEKSKMTLAERMKEVIAVWIDEEEDLDKAEELGWFGCSVLKEK